jgi:formylglycine-generating enzyme required for sulfatase activity
MKLLLTLIASALSVHSFSQTLPASIVMKNITGGTFTMGSNSLLGSPAQQAAAPEHQVNLSPYSISEAEITNAQYVEFLNAAFTDGLIEVVTGTMGPDNGKKIIQGTSSSAYSGKVLYTLDGIRVLKDHDNADGDGDSFTGDVEPENPLNISYIGFNTSTNTFYVKNPYDVNDFHWLNICDYQDYGTTPMQPTGPILNDFDDWSGSGQNLSDELLNWTETNPSAATNLPTQSEVANWPVTFIRWWGAQAFAEYYNMSLPTEAQWEFAAKAGQNFTWATYNGTDTGDANWNTLGIGTVALGHVRAAISGTANPFGLYNLAGNSWEWIADNYVEPYDTNFVTDPLIEEAGSTTRCWRGGSWNYHEATVQSSIRFFDDENRGNDHFGFRIAGNGTTSSLQFDEEGDNWKIYPNPASDVLTVNIAPSTSYLLQVYSIDGVLTYKEWISATTTIDVSNWKNGVYLVTVAGVVKKVMVNHGR